MAAETEPRPKRHKIDIACDICRARKVKCDGARPACSNCLRRLALGDRCNYSGTSNQLPAVSNRHDVPLATPGRSVRDPQSTISFAASTPGQRAYGSPTLLFRASDDAAVVSPNSGSGRTPAAEPAASSIDSMTIVAEEGTQTQQFFGSSSAGSFTKQIKEAIDARMGASPSLAGMVAHAGLSVAGASSMFPAQQSTSSQAPYEEQDRPGSLAADDEANLVLPRRREADRLVELYWRYVDPLYPFLDRRTWVPAYEALFHGGGNGAEEQLDDRVFVSTLNVIFALSTQLSEGCPPPTPQPDPKLQQQLLRKRERQSQVYFARAQDLLQSSLWEAGSLATVQFLLLASQYLQSTNNPHQTWMVVGSAIRTAQSLGLHQPDSAIDQPLHDRELRRRLWHGCVLLDRMVSVTHGRPVMVSSQLATAVPMPLYARAGTQTPDRSDGNGPSMSFFVFSVKLYEISNQAISAFYSNASQHGNGSAAEKDDLPTLLKLDEALLNWEQDLPDHLRFELLDEAEARQRSKVDCKPRQAVILYIRFLQARMLLLRTITSRFCLEPSMPETGLGSLRACIRRDVARICVETATAMIDVLERYQSQDGNSHANENHRSHGAAHPSHATARSAEDIGLLPVWWYRVYYLYSAASILVIAKLRPDVFSLESVHLAWDKAMLLLDGHKRFGLAAHRCLAALDILGGSQRAAAPVPGEQTADNNSSSSLFLHPVRTTDLMHSHHPSRPQTVFGDFDFNGLSFDAQDFSDLNLHAWEVLNQP